MHTNLFDDAYTQTLSTNDLMLSFYSSQALTFKGSEHQTPRLTQPGHHSREGKITSSESWGVTTATWYTNLISVVL